MAGHFLLRNVSQMNLVEATVQGGGKVSKDNFHTDIHATAILSDVLRGASIGNRDDLPAHFYLEFHPGSEGYLARASWVDYLMIPVSPGFGAKSLCADARTRWAGGDKRGAIITQCKTGRAIVEIYFVDGYPAVPFWR